MNTDSQRPTSVSIRVYPWFKFLHEEGRTTNERGWTLMTCWIRVHTSIKVNGFRMSFLLQLQDTNDAKFSGQEFINHG